MLKLLALLPLLLIAGSAAVEEPSESLKSVFMKHIKERLKVEHFARRASNLEITLKLARCRKGAIRPATEFFFDGKVNKSIYLVCGEFSKKYCEVNPLEPLVPLNFTKEEIEKSFKFLPYLQTLEVTLECERETFKNLYKHDNARKKLPPPQKVQYEPAVVTAEFIPTDSFCPTCKSAFEKLVMPRPTSSSDMLLIFIGALAVLAVAFFLYRKKVQKVRAPLAMIQPKLLVQNHYPKDYENQVLVA
ncbi:unnamed protein product [Caenorhabditis auriculariae]|uniref:Uncharacterized protein n=1 Tax=Caenorhabditis auriculariae TaxID=2777116 RepID=A0A8S1HND4_9PELO|nr:unnamed protein product [Caenorhabditis auriculariae]